MKLSDIKLRIFMQIWIFYTLDIIWILCTLVPTFKFCIIA